jgi:ketosteroid isomerase-like protein
MKRINLLWVFAPLLLLFNSCAPTTAHVDVTPTINMDSVKMKISDMEKAFADASNKRDADAVMAYYGDDATSFPPNEKPVVGRAAIASRMKTLMSSDTSGTSMALNSTGVWAGGNYVTETGTWTDMDKTGKVIATGNYMTLFELRDGKYVAIRDMWVRDSPAPLAATMKTDTMQ